MAESGSAKDITLQIKSDAAMAVNGTKPLQEDGKGTRRKFGVIYSKISARQLCQNLIVPQ